MMQMQIEITMNHHAMKRAKQRGIPRLVIGWLYDYGRIIHDKHGATIYFLDKKAKRELQKDFGKHCISRLSDMMDAYLVDVGGTIITVGHRYKKIWRN